MEKNSNSLTDKEKKEIELLDNPKEQRMGNVAGGMPAILWGLRDPFANKRQRKKRVVELRTKMRVNEKMIELGLNPDKDWKKYYQIQKEIKEEEEKRFDKRFKDIS